MSNSKSTIKYTAIISAVFLVLTYLFCAFEIHNCDESPWLPYSFLITVFGGAFTSSIVVLICEIHQYHQKKRAAEDLLYSNAVVLLSNAIVARNTLKYFIEHPEQLITKGVICNQSSIIMQTLNHICNIDYSTFCIKQKLNTDLSQFHSQYNKYHNIINDVIYLDLAINEAELDTMSQNATRPVVTSSSEKVHRTIDILIKHFDSLVNEFEKLAESIDYSGRYNFKERKAIIKEANCINFGDGSLEQFLRKNEYN